VISLPYAVPTLAAPVEVILVTAVVGCLLSFQVQTGKPLCQIGIQILFLFVCPPGHVVIFKFMAASGDVQESGFVPAVFCQGPLMVWERRSILPHGDKSGLNPDSFNWKISISSRHGEGTRVIIVLS